MKTQTILYLNNRYVNSLEELKAYFSSKLNEDQKGELIAAFRDKVLYNWLNEGGEAEKKIAGEMLPILDQHFGNGEVLKKIAELFDVPNPLIADYKFVDHAEYLGCYPIVRSMQTDTAYSSRASNTNTAKNDVGSVGATHRMGFKAMMDQLRPELAEFGERMLSALKESTLVVKESMINTLIGNGEIPQDLVRYGESIRVEKGQRITKIVFIFKILSPENDYLTLRFSFNPEVENVMVNDNLKLDLGGKKNSLRAVTLEIDGEKLPKESALTILHGNDVIGRVNFDNHENTDKVIEATEEPVSEGSPKANIVARVRKQEGYWFYYANAKLALKEDLKLLKNSMYPDLDFGFYYRKTQDETKIRLYYISEIGYQDLGVFSDATPLNEDLVAVRKTNESKFFGIIDKTGKVILEDNKVGQIYGINKDRCLVCEVRPGTQGLANLKGEELHKDLEFHHYFVSPYSDSICSFKKRGDYIELFYLDNKSHSFSKMSSTIDFGKMTIVSVYYFNSFVFIVGVEKNGKKAYSGWFNGSSNNYFVIPKNIKDELLIWLKKPLFPLYKVDSKIQVSEDNRSYYSSCYYVNDKEIKPVFVAERWMLEHGSLWEMYENKEDGFNKISKFCFRGDLFAVYSSPKKQEFIHFEGNAMEHVLLKDELKPEKKPVIKYKGVKKIESIVSYGNYIAIRYLYQADNKKEETHCSLVISREGKEDFRDEWNEFSFVCGPFEDKYYYLNNGELWCTDKNKKKEKLSGLIANNLLNASELYPLGTTGRFVVKYEKGYQIINNQGVKLCDPFYEFNVPVTNCPKEMVMDYIYNSQYLPIKNEEGKCGLIDTYGNIIVPCEYDEVEDLDSVFKREGIVVF